MRKTERLSSYKVVVLTIEGCFEFVNSPGAFGVFALNTC
ncbi:hypothetical protein SAMN04488577_2589 [Bacillus sp. cl95]|nr:hypothetical protein SAMN02799634_102468 [Bacillus sp. UNCCL13]SFQ85211.1 hypothetical protein SAMN04488577_2589 [Bacillus sp. cl95]